MDIKDIIKMRSIKCECGCDLFEEREMFRVASKLVTQSGRDELVPISIPVCSSCGKPSREFLKIGTGLSDDEIDALLGSGAGAPAKSTIIGIAENP